MSEQDIKSFGQKAVEQARKEIDEERLEKSVATLKKLYRARAEAVTVLDNINREIDDAERAIEQGNLSG